MDITIHITEQDLIKNPEIIDALKLIADSLKDEESNHVEESTALEAVQEEQYTPADWLAEEMEKEAEAEEALDPVEVPSEEEKQEPKEIPYTQEDVRKAVSSYARKHSAAQAKEILMKHGASKVTDLDPCRYEDVIKECEV